MLCLPTLADFYTCRLAEVLSLDALLLFGPIPARFSLVGGLEGLYSCLAFRCCCI